MRCAKGMEERTGLNFRKSVRDFGWSLRMGWSCDLKQRFLDDENSVLKLTYYMIKIDDLVVRDEILSLVECSFCRNIVQNVTEHRPRRRSGQPCSWC